MKRANPILRVFSLAFLACAASQAVAAPAPVTSLDGTNTAVKRLERQLTARNQVQINMQNQLASLLKELDELRGLVERNNYEIQMMNEKQQDLYKEIAELRQPKSATTAPKPAQSGNAVYSASHSENAQYDAAVDMILTKKDYNGATQAFEAFIATYPKSVYAPNVYYWLGQLKLSKSELSAAKNYFTQVISFKDSNKRAEALLKLGVIASRQEDKVTATKLYKQVVAEFPNTTSASEAKKLLK